MVEYIDLWAVEKLEKEIEKITEARTAGLITVAEATSLVNPRKERIRNLLGLLPPPPE